jgi:lysophospholipase L1-like esterase
LAGFLKRFRVFPSVRTPTFFNLSTNAKEVVIFQMRTIILSILYICSSLFGSPINSNNIILYSKAKILNINEVILYTKPKFKGKSFTETNTICKRDIEIQSAAIYPGMCLVVFQNENCSGPELVFSETIEQFPSSWDQMILSWKIGAYRDGKCTYSDENLDDVILIGDSITDLSFKPKWDGFGYNLSNVYINQFKVINKGITRYTSYDGLALSDSILTEYSGAIELSIIYLGGNDAASYSNVTIAAYYDNMKALALKMSAVGKVLLITPNPVYMVDKPTRTNEVTILYRNTILMIGNETNIPVLDLWPVLMGEDLDYSK